MVSFFIETISNIILKPINKNDNTEVKVTIKITIYVIWVSFITDIALHPGYIDASLFFAKKILRENYFTKDF